MNYIELIKRFWRSHEEHSFSTTEIALYFHLLEICNICRWKNPFKRNNSKIEADLGISYNTLKNARHKLAQCGLISFKTQNGSPNVTYTLSEFDKVTNEVATEVGKNFPTSSNSDEVTSEVNNEVGSEVTSEVTNEVSPTKYKLNKKQTKQSISPSIPQGMNEGEDFFNEDLDKVDEKYGVLRIDETGVQNYVDANGVSRNPKSLRVKLHMLKIQRNEFNEICRLCNVGEIGHPIWMLLKEIESGKHKGINHLDKFILSKLRSIS